MDGNPCQSPIGLSQGCSFPLRSLLEQLKKLQAIVLQSTSKSAQAGTCIAVSPTPGMMAPRIKGVVDLDRPACGRGEGEYQ